VVRRVSDIAQKYAVAVTTYKTCKHHSYIINFSCIWSYVEDQLFRVDSLTS